MIAVLLTAVICRADHPLTPRLVGTGGPSRAIRPRSADHPEAAAGRFRHLAGRRWHLATLVVHPRHQGAGQHAALPSLGRRETHRPRLDAQGHRAAGRPGAWAKRKAACRRPMSSGTTASTGCSTATGRTSAWPRAPTARPSPAIATPRAGRSSTSPARLTATATAATRWCCASAASGTATTRRTQATKASTMRAPPTTCSTGARSASSPRAAKSGDGPYSAECPFVVEPQPGHFYLFRTQAYGKNAQTHGLSLP